MKVTLRDVQASVASWTVRLKKLLDPPLTADAQPLEIREWILDAIEQRAVPAGAGQRVLAHNQISVTVLAPTQSDRLTLQAVLADLQDATVSRLREVRCQAEREVPRHCHASNFPLSEKLREMLAKESFPALLQTLRDI